MVAEVVLSVMGNRSDRRFPNLSCRWALEAADVTRRRRADFHQGQAVKTWSDLNSFANLDGLTDPSELPMPSTSWR